MNHEDYKLIKSKLENIKEYGAETKSVGICYNLNQLLVGVNEKYERIAYYFVSSHCQDWEYFSGDTDFPVGNGAKDAYIEPWEGEQLKLRLLLIDHLIKKCDEHLGVNSQ